MKQWRYYNHAIIPISAPHEEINTADIYNGNLWRQFPRALLIRWTSEWDCKQETNWWYTICDKPFNIDDLKAKRRYVINKGKKNFYVRVINPSDFGTELYRVYVAAVKSYPPKNQMLSSFEDFNNGLKSRYAKQGGCVYAAFQFETNKLCAYAVVVKHDSYFDLDSQKADPDYEKMEVNAALIAAILEDNVNALSSGAYCNDGARSVNHETHFQEYLEKYFGFRKAYCKIHLAYRPSFRLLVFLFYPLRKLLLLVDNVRIFHLINSVLSMEELQRNSNNSQM